MLLRDKQRNNILENVSYNFFVLFSDLYPLAKTVTFLQTSVGSK